jgi:hypothetical protein
MELVKHILVQTDWLYTILFQNALFFLDLWSIVHIWSGFCLILLLKSLKVKRPFLILFAILTIYEIIELVFIFFAFNIFKPETILDQCTDIVAGISGGILAYNFLKFATNGIHKHIKMIYMIIILLSAVTYAFPWVGFYKYHYNLDFLNTPGINLFSLVLWITGGYITIHVFRTLKYNSPSVRMVITWIFYLIILVVVEFSGYVLLGIHENSKPGASSLFFGLIHGNRILHIFYLISPLWTISIYSVFNWLCFKAIDLGKSEIQLRRVNNTEMAHNF